MLRGGGILVWRVLFSSLSHQWVACTHAYDGQRHTFDTTVCGICTGSGIHAENHYRHIARFLDSGSAATVLYRIRGVGRKRQTDACGRKRPLAVHHSVFGFVNSMSGSDRMGIQ